MNDVKIWAVGDGEKVLRDDLNHPDRSGNSVWNGKIVRLFGARNETVAFQLIVETGEEGIGGVHVDMSALLHASGQQHGSIANRTDSAGNAAAVTPWRRIEVFTQHYLYVPPELSTLPQWFYAESAPPKHRTGWIPDALIPADARADLGGQPVTVSPRANQGFWIDISIPNEEALTAGVYRGQVDVRYTRSGAETALVIPVELQLFDFALPDENHSKTFVYVSDVSAYFPETPEWRDELRRMAHRHRFDLVGSEAHNQPFDAEMMEPYRKYLDGSFFTRENGYEGPGEGVGEQVFPIGMYGDPVLGDSSDPAAMQAEADKWVSYFDGLEWRGAYFLYLIDEPRNDKFPWIREQVGIVRGSAGPGKRLPILTTRAYDPEIADAIDIWCAHKIDPQTASHCAETADRAWFYNGYRPYHGSLILEAEAVDLRANSWLRWRYGIEGYFIWHGTHWKHNHQGPRGRWHQNVYGYPVTFMYVSNNETMFYGKDGVHWGNGDGLLFYPGREPFFQEQDRGVNGPISSIRMKNLRRGIQDYEYLWLAAQRGRRTEADAIAREAVPAGMHETAADGPASWSSCGSDWDGYRRKAAELIAATGFSGS